MGNNLSKGFKHPSLQCQSIGWAVYILIRINQHPVSATRWLHGRREFLKLLFGENYKNAINSTTAEARVGGFLGDLSDISKHPYLTSAKAVNVVPQGEVKMDVHRENTVVRWVGFHPLMKQDKKAQIQTIYEKFYVHLPNCLNKQVLQK